MKKVAIIGPEGSGKTVMLAGLGSLYERPDENGYYLEPIDRKTYSYVNGLVHGMRNGLWPAATEIDAQKRLTWNLRQKDGESSGDIICRISFFDFAGEIYRDAFGRDKGVAQKHKEESRLLCRSVRQADVVFVLVNLSDIITGRGGSARATEIGWATKSMLDYIYAPNVSASPTTVIVLSQADSYKAIIETEGGPKETLEKYLPVVSNTYSNVEVITVASVDRVVLDDEGNTVPDGEFTFAGLKVMMDVMLREMEAENHEEEDVVDSHEADDPTSEASPASKPRSSGFWSIILGSIIVGALLFFVSWCPGFIVKGGIVTKIMAWLWLFAGAMVFGHGFKRMAAKSLIGLIITVVLISWVWHVIASLVPASNFMKGLGALGLDRGFVKTLEMLGLDAQAQFYKTKGGIE